MENDKKSSGETEDVEHILDYENPEHGRLLLCQLAELRDNARLCDVTLVAEGARISAHRVVLAATTDYFKAMFTNNMAESDSDTIELKGVEATALEALINFCYYGKIRISSTNVWSVLPTACLLQLNEVKEQCSEFLKKQLNAANCLKIRDFADTYACARLLSCACEVILHNFKDVIGTDGFYRLPCNQLEELISSDQLQVQSEEQVFEAVADWVRFDQPARQQLFPQLFKHVRLPLCDSEFLVNTVSKDPLVNSNDVCRNLVDKAKDKNLPIWPRKVLTGGPEMLYVVGGSCYAGDHASVERLDPGESNPASQSVAPMSTRRKGVGVAVFRNLLFAVGGYDGNTSLNSSERFNPATGAWSSDIASMSHCRWLHGVATLDDFIYAVGGYEGYERALNVVERYDPRQNQWTSVAPMGEERARLSVSVLNGCLYAVGGSNESSVERFDPREGNWEQIHPMATPRKYLGCAVFDGHLYAAGGLNLLSYLSSVEKYDPRMERWTEVADMNEKRCGVALAVVNGKLYAVGGANGTTILDTIEVFDTEANQWIIHSRMNERREVAGVGALLTPYRSQHH